ncbi:hypothetical protein [Nocardia sp. NPDC050710]|uniref:hypothetical protein n=1 Tax=Nocardia sp. NPDC050710 TaxID=3157220 RepID=UPI0033E3D77C
MVWERGSEIIEGAHIGHIVTERRAHSWLLLIFGTFGFMLLVAMIVLLLVSNADFDTGPTEAPPTSGTCAPFCTADIPSPAPGGTP